MTCVPRHFNHVWFLYLTHEKVFSIILLNISSKNNIFNSPFKYLLKPFYPTITTQYKRKQFSLNTNKKEKKKKKESKQTYFSVTI